VPLTGRVIVATRVPVAMAVGTQVRVNVGSGTPVTCGAIVPVDMGRPVVGIGMIVPVGAMIGLGGSSVTEGLVGLAGGLVGGRPVGLDVLVLVNVGEGATVCVAVAT